MYPNSNSSTPNKRLLREGGETLLIRISCKGKRFVVSWEKASYESEKIFAWKELEKKFVGKRGLYNEEVDEVDVTDEASVREVAICRLSLPKQLDSDRVFNLCNVELAIILKHTSSNYSTPLHKIIRSYMHDSIKLLFRFVCFSG